MAVLQFGYELYSSYGVHAGSAVRWQHHMRATVPLTLEYTYRWFDS